MCLSRDASDRVKIQPPAAARTSYTCESREDGRSHGSKDGTEPFDEGLRVAGLWGMPAWTLGEF